MRDEEVLNHMVALNDISSSAFVPTVFHSWDVEDFAALPQLGQSMLQTYIVWAKTVVRNETDVVMVTHLLVYLFTSIPSAVYLYCHFHWIHGILHTIVHVWYAGSYTLMMHQHIHMGGVLARRYWWLDSLFPYITDPLMGHTWNSYYYHHVKHHHVEGNGPDDLSSTIRYQRDSVWDFAKYVARFFFLIWLELPVYFLRKRKARQALKAGGSDLGSYLFVYLMASKVNIAATVFVFVLPLIVMRLGLMAGNWGQHAFVDDTDPGSDYRSSITLIDVASNRYCFNDGYHTSHHLNPRRHWRNHPISFLRQKHIYAQEAALVFHNIDYLGITLKLLQKDYRHLARCLVPIGDQIGMTLAEIEALLETKTRRFSEADIAAKFKVKGASLQGL